MNLENEIINLCDKADINGLSRLEKMKEELSN